jgi:hypothetical protein
MHVLWSNSCLSSQGIYADLSPATISHSTCHAHSGCNHRSIRTRLQQADLDLLRVGSTNLARIDNTVMEVRATERHSPTPEHQKDE